MGWDHMDVTHSCYLDSRWDMNTSNPQLVVAEVQGEYDIAHT